MFKETYRRLNDIIQPDKALVAAVLAGGQRRKRGGETALCPAKTCADCSGNLPLPGADGSGFGCERRAGL